MSSRRIPQTDIVWHKLYDNGAYVVQIHAHTGHTVVHRYGDIQGVRMVAHVGEKTARKTWKETTLQGCPEDIREAIVAAWRAYKEQKAKQAEAAARI
jgi:hypothetical protein